MLLFLDFDAGRARKLFGIKVRQATHLTNTPTVKPFSFFPLYVPKTLLTTLTLGVNHAAESSSVNRLSWKIGLGKQN